ncbi:MAG: tetratricopeptide repeat protein, partial [Myxococcota bacterium]|nr:tetratricopeptide repeat protein [Myxococcota bacterium]
MEIRALQRSGEFDGSIEPIRVLLHTDPTNAEANYRLGVALVQTGRNGLAIWPLQKAAQSDEYGVESGIVLAGLLSSAGDYEEAVRTADQVLSIDPDRVAAIYTRGEANIGAGRPEAALEDAERLLEIRESDYEAFLIRASALTDLERLDEAEQAFRDMIVAAGKLEVPSVQGKACALLAAHLASQKKVEEADAQYQECLENFPDQPIVMQYATNYYTEFDRPDDAIAMWRSAVEESPENFVTRASLAELLMEQNRSEEAEAVLLEAVDLFDTAAAWQSLSTFYQKQGDVTSARKALENALD